MLCVYVLLQRIIILVVGSYENNCLNLAKYLDKPFGISESLIALVRERKEVKERAQLLLIRKKTRIWEPGRKEKKRQTLIERDGKAAWGNFQRLRIFVFSLRCTLCCL